MSIMRTGALLSCAICLTATADAADEVVLTLKEPLGHNWSPQWVSFPLKLPRGAFQPDDLAMTSADSFVSFAVPAGKHDFEVQYRAP